MFVLIFIAGIASYIKTPKEIFPVFDLDMVGVFGHYSGASIDTLDNMAVKEIESEIKNIDGISKIATVVSSGRFQIIMELTKDTDRYDAANRIKDAVSIAKQNIPSDMDDPVVNVLQIQKPLINIALSSSSIDYSGLIREAEKLKEKILSIKNIAEVVIYGDADQYYDVSLLESSIKALGLNESGIIQAISSLSCTFPVGKIEDPIKGHHYISTYNGAKTAKELMDTKISVSGKTVKLADIATVEKRYRKSATLFSVNTQNAIDLDIRQTKEGNAIEIAKKIEKILKSEELSGQDIKYTIHNDRTEADI